jgi:hypothetical protein
MLVARIMDTASTVNGAQTWNIYSSNAVTLLQLSGWLNATEGYGNVMLGIHSCEIAYLCLAKMIFDMSCPLSNVEQVLSLYKMPWYTPEAAADMLNDEAGSKLFIGSNETSAVGPYELDTIWVYGSAMAEGGGEADQVLKCFYHFAQHDTIMSNLSLFVEDHPLSRSLEVTWDTKQHHFLTMIGGGLIDDKRKSLVSALVYRQQLGCFPTNLASVNTVHRPSTGLHEHTSSQHATQYLQDAWQFPRAFSRAWNIRKKTSFTEGDTDICVRAADLYAQIVNGYVYCIDQGGLGFPTSQRSGRTVSQQLSGDRK